ncbi:zinc-ribbon domain-containing protein [Rubinisphaera sp. JC750]|uniref:zinc-ribbon domain-containing protein n=1 Tax=Rubinisphaera sp. JC750 TaxID=2898658 RepID=UPI001F3B18C2|nr:zinc-ribbon domain-containing protein [Rubinisphaera sp. JC750]
MAGLTIPCPKCDAPLKLKDRRLLGKTGKCPRCGHKFVLQEQTEAPLELVEEPPVGPAEGKNATWIPDSPAAATPPATPQQPPAGTPVPAAQTPPVPTPPPQQQDTGIPGLFGDNTEQPAAGGDDPLGFLNSEQPASSTQETANPLGDLVGASSPAAAPATAAATTSRRKRRRRRSSGGGTMTFVAILVLAAGGGFWYYQSTQSNPIVVKKSSPSSDTTSTAATDNTSNTPSDATPVRPTRYNAVAEMSPTSGQPVELLHMPAGVRVVINLHPAQLWSSERKFAEFRASLGPLAPWLETKIQELAKQPPANIERMVIGLILGPRGVPPEVAAVVHLAEPQQRADLLATYTGRAHQEFNPNIKVENGRAYHIIDDQTVATCPELYVDDLETFAKSPAMTADNIQEMLKQTDRDRLLTVVFEPSDLDQHQNSLFPAGSELAVKKTLSFLGDDIWTAAWSLNVADDFYSQLVVRGENSVGPISLSKRYQERLDVIPELLLTSVQKMNPQRSGYRKLIGRYPAMMKVVSLATSVAVEGQFVQLGVLLPSKAAPNLALGTLLTWDESTRTDFTTQAVVTTQKPQKVDKAKLPMSERLQLKMDVDFRRTPLQEAFAYIADESKIPIEIDGDALKLAGFTKNMPQTFQMNNATTLQAIYGIVKNYEAESAPLAIHVDEKNNRILVLTVPVAAKQNLSTFDFKAAGMK